MAIKKTRRDKAIERWEDYYKRQVFGATSGYYRHLEALGRKMSSDGSIGFVTPEERMDALCRIVIAMADDISHIYRVLEVYQKMSDDSFLEKQFELIRTLAVDKYNREETEKAEKRAKKSLQC